MTAFKTTSQLFLFTSLIVLFFGCNVRNEKHAADIIQSIQTTRQSILESYRAKGDSCDDCEFWAVWDFDGTILKGDCTEGLFDKNGNTVYNGLAAESIKAGFAPAYNGPTAVSDFFTDYRAREKKDHLDAYTYIVKMYAGTPEASIRKKARSMFNSVYRDYLFRSSVQMLKGLHLTGIRNIVISASAQFFVQEADDLIPVERGDIHGITVEIKDEKITNQIVQPVTYAAGKAEKLKQLINSSGKRIFLLGGFGNSYSTDGNFLEMIKNRRLPAGKPVVVMINGANPPEKYRGAFKSVTQTLTLKHK